MVWEWFVDILLMSFLAYIKYEPVQEFAQSTVPQSFATGMSLPHTLGSEKSNNQMQITHHHYS